jgi:hypothetical protein
MRQATQHGCPTSLLSNGDKGIEIVYSRETRERWPLLTVVTEVNGDSWSTNERDPSLVGSLGVMPVLEIFVQPWLL